MRAIHRKHPLSLAISISLLAMVATSAVAGPAQDQGQADAQNQQSSAAAPQSSAKPGNSKPENANNPVTLSVINVVGVRASQMRAVELKQTAPNIQDSITTENIGQLPDVTISDSLQRVTGVQINRDAGVGSSVDVRGLPEVGTLLNGEVFITPDQIDSQQPDFSTLPASLFRGVDVLKSPMASTVGAGISGTVNLHTYRPWDLPHGWTFSGSVDGTNGDVSNKWQPQASGLIGFNAGGRWGVLLNAEYSDVTRENSNEGLDQYGVVLNGENAASADQYGGFLTSFDPAPVPPQIHQFPNGDVDVNGDGKPNGVFMGSQDISVYDKLTQRRRKSLNASFQADLGGGFTLTSDMFFTRQDQYDRVVGYQFNSLSWQGASYIPLVSRNTGAPISGEFGAPEPGWDGMQLFTTQVYQKWPGDVESFSQILQTGSVVRNFNAQLDFDNGGPFTFSMRGIRDTAHQLQLETDINISNADGTQWPNDPPDAAPPGVFIYPSQLGGNRVFNANGIPPNSIPVTVDVTGRTLGISLPPELAQHFATASDWALKTIEANPSYDNNVGLTALRFDGHYDFGNNFNLDFGIRHSIRTATSVQFAMMSPVYAGMGASDPNGCMVMYHAADVVMDGGGIDGACTAGNSQGYFRAGVLSATPPSEWPALLRNNFKQYSNLGGINGVTIWAIDPQAMDNPVSFLNALYPGQQRIENPGATWKVGLHETTGYVQGNFKGDLGSIPFSGNVGVRVVRTNLDVTQHLTGATQPYGLPSLDNGTQLTLRSYRDILPAANIAFDLTDKFKLRLAYSKNMMPLNLSTWGGGLTLNYALSQTQSGNVFAVTNGQSTGNPNLDPWRSTNYDASLEYYINRASMVSLGLFRINVQSFINQGSVQNCDLPDMDGVVRHRCIAISEPLQGTGNSLHGVEFDYRQAFTFLPGLLRNTGMEFNFTYSPSDSGQRDLAGNAIPFQDNSKEQSNLILWYQDNKLQVRVAGNYRSKRAVSANNNAILGMELYQAPTTYVDASVSYNLTKHIQLYFQGSNLTNEYERYYLVWPDQAAHVNLFERRYTVGVRGSF